MQELYDFAKELAQTAGEITLNYYQKDFAVESKADDSPVTIADRSAEDYLRKEIAARYPDDGIVGEEHGVKESRSGRRWILDPIDGTKSFIREVPLYGTMIAVEWDGKPQIGVIRFPPLGITLSAMAGHGCFQNGKPCRVSSEDSIENASIMSSDFQDIAKHQGEEAMLRLHSHFGLARTWGDCYGYYLLASGKVDAMMDAVVQIWDVAPLIPIIQEAGGTITRLDGTTDISMNHVIATNGKLHQPLLDLLNQRSAYSDSAISASAPSESTSSRSNP